MRLISIDFPEPRAVRLRTCGCSFGCVILIFTIISKRITPAALFASLAHKVNSIGQELILTVTLSLLWKGTLTDILWGLCSKFDRHTEGLL